MQFVKNGPEIPERLLQRHEEGQVVFFCGAGISYPAGLPDFKGLVDQIYGSINTTPDPLQRSAIKAGQFDTAIGLLEASVVGCRPVVRKALATALVPDLSRPNALATHDALLTLGRSREGHTRLVTTNFDRLFVESLTQRGDAVESFKAPLLPVPKNRWDGLVYLHGLLVENPTTADLDRLVVSSGDFGLAYLTERWAARFVSELFRNFTVCFVGYSVNDPVLRYMMDAIAADRLLGESTEEVFGFGNYSKGAEEQLAADWRAKNVTPILYRERNRHAYLHKTLQQWAATYRDGATGKERIVIESAWSSPTTGTEQDDLVGRMLWALSDSSGRPAKRFADHVPVPPLEWLEPLSARRFGHTDLPRFGVQPKPVHDDKLTFSLVDRPSPYDLSSSMSLLNTSRDVGRWDDVMFQIARWLTRHLNDPELLIWLAKRSGRLHPRLERLIENRLEQLDKLARQGNTEELERIEQDSPSSIPDSAMETLWRMVLTGRIGSQTEEFGLEHWLGRFRRFGLTPSIRLQLLELLTPRVVIYEPTPLRTGDSPASDQRRIADLVSWSIVLTANRVHSNVQDLATDSTWRDTTPELLTDFTQLLKSVLDLSTLR